MCIYYKYITYIYLYIYIYIIHKFKVFFLVSKNGKRKHLKSIMVVSTKKMSLWKRMVSTLSPKIPFESLASLVISPNKCEQHKCWTSPPCIMQIKTYKNIIKLENPTSSKFIHSHLRANSAKKKHIFFSGGGGVISTSPTHFSWN